MRKIIIGLLIFILMLTNVAYASSPSITIRDTIKCKPKVEFTILNYQEDGTFTWEVILAILNEQLPNEQFEKFHLDEILRLHLEEEYEEIAWYFIVPYQPQHNVYALFVNEDGTIIITKGIVQEDSWIVFDFSEVQPEYVIMYVFSDM